MKERFEGANLPHLITALLRQEVTCGVREVADGLAAGGLLVEYQPGDNIILQSAHDNEIYFLVAGVVEIIINGAQITTRKAGQHVGEVGAIEPSIPRSATVSVLEQVVALKVTSAKFMELGERFPLIFRPLAQELARRLYQRNAQIFVPNKKPQLFVISSTEAKAVAYSVRDGLSADIQCKVWDKGVFFAGGYPLEALELQVSQSDYALAIAAADDIVISRGTTAPTVRDNVLFELGLFMGKLTRYRAILAHPRVKDLRLPSDLQGLTIIPFDDGGAATLSDRVKPICDQIGDLVKKRGVRTFTVG